MESTPTHGGGVVVRPAADGWEVLLVRPLARADEWVLPKGHIEPGETPEAAAIREVQEEAGVDAEILGFVRMVDYPVRTEAKRVAFFLMRRLGDVQPAEVRGQFWCPFDEAATLVSFPELAQLLREAARHPALGGCA